MRAVITGGAGFLGSHLCDAMLERGWDVLCIDNLITGQEANVAHLLSHPKFGPRFRIVRHDVSKHIDVPGPVEAVLHFASPASPVDYLKHPIPTLKVGSLGTHNALGLALAKGAKFLMASTSECYGDPEVSSAAGNLLGTREFDRARAAFTTRPNDFPKRLPWRITAITAWTRASCEFSTLMGRGCD